MLVVWILTAIMQSLNWQPAVELWAWFGHHVLLTILLILFLA
jgi:hypothetical protein